MAEETATTHGNHTEVYIHLAWSTWSRAPVFEHSLHESVFACIREGCARRGAEVIALNGVADHVHLLVRMPTPVAIADIAKQAKGASSHLVNRQREAADFRWQDGYSAFSVSRWDVPKIAAYIAGQQAHHRQGTAKEPLEPR